MTKTIMIIDDDESLLTLVGKILRRESLTSIKAPNAEIALSLVEAINVDLFIIDLMMPIIDGFELCRILRQDSRTANIPIVMLSIRDDPKSINESLNAGANTFISKKSICSNLSTAVHSLL